MAKTRVAVLFGGVSSEHEISCVSAAAIVDNMSTDKYDVLKIGITKKGRWLLYPGGTDKMREGTWDTFTDCVPAFISPDSTTRGIVTNSAGTFDVNKIDVVFPVLHGRNGEDGTVQGLLDLSGIPYVGCGVLSSAACMDKVIANQLFEAAGIPHTPWMSVSKDELENFEKLLFRLSEKIRFPLFVKPAIGGSSVGVTKVKDPDELRTAIQLALAHDRKVLIEQAVNGKEVECAVLGNAEPICSLPGEIVACNEVYDYEAKYQSGDSSKLHLPARLSAEKMEELRMYAVRAYKAMDCAGLSRVDFFVQEDGAVLLNEINTLPGFTPISMYPKLMEMTGFSFGQLVDQLISLALERAEQ